MALRHLLAKPIAGLGLGKVPPPPPDMVGGIGPGDFFAIGEELVALLKQTVGVRKSDHILDVGCGLGRLVPPLRRSLGARGRYMGIDVVLRYIRWCVDEISSRDARFSFQHLDVASREYNRDGRMSAVEARLPFSDRTFSLAIATSLFTHLAPEAAENYLHEISRVLEPGGRLFSTFFLVDSGVLSRMASGGTAMRFPERLGPAYVESLEVPERAIAFDRSWLEAKATDAGLLMGRGSSGGTWSAAGGATFQDLLVWTKS